MSKFAKGNKGAIGMADDIGPSGSMDEYAAFGADIDLFTRNGTIGATKQDLVPRGIIVTDAGAGTKKLALVMADGTASFAYDCTNLVGVLLPICPRTITNTTTTIARVLVLY